jgi:hypothetical protein
MNASLRQSLLKHLGAIALTCGLMDPAPLLLQIPVEWVSEVVEEPGDVEWNASDRLSLLRLLSHDARTAVRSRVAESVGEHAEVLRAERVELTRALARDPSERVRSAASESLAAVLRSAPPIERVELVCSWASSDDWRDRAAIARALRHSTPVPLADVAIEVLAVDERDEVRLAAVEAAERHYDESAEQYRRIAMRRVSDPERHVRRLARRIVTRHA